MIEQKKKKKKRSRILFHAVHLLYSMENDALDLKSCCRGCSRLEPIPLLQRSPGGRHAHDRGAWINCLFGLEDG